ncbi:MAG: TonB-dependent receptor [Bacteroidetes bacterium]|nr:TonB-dependent receptor [Bacteroidota bacterium]
MNKGPFSLLNGLIICLLAIASAHGQKAFIKVIDKKNSEPVAYAHVCFEGLKTGKPQYSLTSIDGIVTNEVHEPSKIVVSFMGYTTFKDTVRPGQSVEIRLIPSILNMNEVVVTAQYTPEKVDKSIYRIEVINARQIEMKAATNMSDLLKNQSGMQVSQDGVLGTSLRIQGLSGQNVKFLQDGVPMIGRMNGNFDLNQINLNNVDHVELIEGPMSVIYGSNALAGVINVITKENKTSLLSATANTYYESVGVFNFDASVSGCLKKNGFMIDGGRNFSPGYSATDTSRSKTFKPRRQYFFDGYYTFTTGGFKLKLGGDYFNELLEDKGALQPVYYINALDSYFTTIRYSTKAEVSIKLPRNKFINLLASYSYYERRKQKYDMELTTLEMIPITNSDGRDTTSISSWIGRGTFAVNNPDHKLNYQTGIDIDVETGAGKRILGHNQQIGDYAAFFSLKYDPVKSFSVQPGVRFIYNTKYSAPIVYALSAKWNMSSDWNLRFSYARGFRAPDLKELYLNFQDVNHDVIGNPDLKAEQSNNFNLGLNWNTEKRKTAWNAEVNGFYNLINNVILLAPTGITPNQYTYVNLSKYTTAGGTGSLGFSLYPELKLLLSISETGVTGSLDEGTKPDPLHWLTELSCSINFSISKPGLSFAMYYKYTGTAPQVVFNDKSLAWGYVDPYNLMDITATKGFWENRIRLSAGIKNLFNVTTVPASGMVGTHGSGGDGMNIAWGRTFFIKFSFTFNKYK